ncbi:rhodanese-like domain-containing protein [Lignipirellula cremea]|uniref:Molybdopterin biosynthesis protein MoeB n=1 Tax=Lignipirellula cremea TaxID=2528010 RepID=A0A518DUY7_9BACT|nr:rhodanese-like domain-containing protein [Lignipirellula cremea]QDU95637.1 molybdopterin biosynthesis protein MoeB [Lignipirellula cremea]
MQTINTTQFKNMIDEMGDELTIINTLDSEHFSKTEIPGSTNIPLSQNDFLANVEKTAGNKKNAVVVYCASEECDSSKKAAEKLHLAGFETVFDYEGGAQAWKESGAELAAK